MHNTQQLDKLVDIMRWIDAYAADFAAEGKIAKSRQDVERAIAFELSGGGRLARPTSKDSWQPIDTAPKDGTEIWAFNDGEQALMRWIEGPDFGLWLWVDPLLSDADPSPIQPTHWMKKPAPPGEDAGQ